MNNLPRVVTRNEDETDDVDDWMYMSVAKCIRPADTDNIGVMHFTLHYHYTQLTTVVVVVNLSNFDSACRMII